MTMQVNASPIPEEANLSWSDMHNERFVVKIQNGARTQVRFKGIASHFGNRAIF